MSVNSLRTPWAFRRRATSRPPWRVWVSSASVVMARQSTPAVRGVCRAGGPGIGARGATSFRSMDTTPSTDKFTADLELLLRESDREDPILPEIRDADQAPEEEIDARILAGLVSP